MIGIKHIVLYICMLQVIFRHLTGTLAAKVSINQNITGLLGSNDTHLTCSFFLEKGEQMLSVQINAKNITDDFDNVTMPIAIFIPWKTAKLLTPGTYLSSRVTLTNITTTSTNATMTFHKLKCTDEKDYMCKLYYNDSDSDTSNVTRILVKASPSMPDGISSFIVSPKKTETEVTPTSYIFRDSNKASTKTNQNSSASFPALPSYLKTLTILESPIYIRGGDILMLTCTGNIGKPPGKLLWQKISLQQNKSITYANITTYVEEIPGRCSFKGTSNLTVQISADDLKVKFRCFEESQANVAGMYVETEPFDVHSNNSLPTTEPESRKIFLVNGAYAIPVFYQVVVVVLCFAVRKRYSKREKMNIYSEISDDQETISVDNEYEEIESVFYHEVNLHNGRIETSKQPISEEEIVLENIPISTSTSSSESNITLSHLYVNTNIFNTNENRTMSANNETISNHQNGLGNCNIGVDNTFVSDNSGSDTLHVHQYVNMSSLRVPNVYEDLNHTTTDTQKYESLN